MEDISGNNVLMLNNEEQLKKKKEKILETLDSDVDVFFFYDTETTGLNPYPKANGRDRILEVAFIAYYLDDQGEFHPLEVDGQPVTFQEYTNPFAESAANRQKTRSVQETNPAALAVHGITNNFLSGKESLGSVKLDGVAPTFSDVKPFMEDFLCFDEQGDYDANIHFVSFNGKSFDDKMLEEEMKYVDMYDPSISYKRSFESFMSSAIDTKLLMQKLYSRTELKENGELSGTKAGHSLDYLSKLMDVDLSARADVHGGLLDSIILKDAFSALIKTERYQGMHNKYKFNTFKTKEVPVVESVIDEYVHGEGGEKLTSLNLIKTDASFSAGTGTVKEYVEKAKEAGLDNLVLADNVSLNRFVEFYEECGKANIKPIMATNFKLESNFDIYNIFGASKEQSSTARKLMLDLVNTAIGEEGVSFEKLVSDDYKLNDPMAWGELITKVKRVQSSIMEGGKMPQGLAKSLNNLLEVGGKKTKMKVADIKEVIERHESIQEFQSFDRITGHSNITLIAEDDDGYETLKKLITVANRDGQHYVPQGKERAKGEEPLLKLEDIEKYNDGVFALLGANGDVLDKAIKSGYKTMPNGVIKNLNNALDGKVAVQLSTVADLDSEVSIYEDKVRIDKLMKVAKENSLPIMAAQNAVFANKEDFKIHTNKAAILLDKQVNDFSFDVPESKYDYLKSQVEMEATFKNNKQAMVNAEAVISGIKNNIELDKPSLPDFKTEGGATQAEELIKRAYIGLEKRVKSAYEKTEGDVDFADFYAKYKKRLDYELDVIIQMDFPGYFLIKQQMIEFCKSEGIPVGAGRGSAAGSLVVYSLGITDVDPIEHNLIFERFLNPERKEMPDIDTDIDGEHREKVLNFLREQYAEDGGEFEGAAYIMTKGTFSAKNTIKMLGKAKGYSATWCEDLTKLMGKEPDIKLSNELEENEVLAERYRTESRTRKFIDEAIGLEKNGGRQVSVGKHAGGIVVGNLISQAPITYVNGIPVVQYDKNEIERAGAVKFDLLGLNTLSKLDVALKNIVEKSGNDELMLNNIDFDGKNFNFDNFKYNDKDTYKLLQNANSSNVFQIESDMFKGLLKLIKPENLDEITALVSLGRPGPLQSEMHLHFAESKFDKSKRRHYHDLIDNVLDETHGTIIYQEQVMAIGQKMGGFTMGGADKLRKAMGKKKIEEMEKQKVLFIDGAEEKGVDSELSNEIFDTVEKFAGYGFNKSHAMSYSLLTYKMAYLRQHYPTEFMAAILSVDSNENESKKKIAKAAESLKEVGLVLFTPNVNESESRFKVGDTNGILFGFDGVTGLPKKDKAMILEAREDGLFTSLEDFMKRSISGASVSKLIQGGGMDGLPLMSKPNQKVLQYVSGLDKIEKKMFKRAMVMKEYEVLSPLMGTKDKRIKYKIGAFKESSIIKGYEDVLSNFKENKNKMLSEGLALEEDSLSTYITAHPLNVGGLREKIIAKTTLPHVPMSELEERIGDEGGMHNVAGMIKELAHSRISRAGNKYAVMDISDGTKLEKIFLNNDEFLELNSKMKAENGFGVEEGMAISLDLKHYKNDNDEMKTKVGTMFLPEYDIAFDNPLKQQKKRNTYRR